MGEGDQSKKREGEKERTKQRDEKGKRGRMRTYFIFVADAADIVGGENFVSFGEI